MFMSAYLYWYYALIVLLFHYSVAQLPKACTTEEYTGKCCPDVVPNGECNGISRGECVDISNSDPWDRYCANLSNESLRNETNKYCKTLKFLRERPDTNKPDFRYNWPAQIFTHVCKCKGNWAGYDCSRCKRGYNGTDCQNRTSVVRKSFLDLSPSEKNRIIEVFNMAKDMHMESDFTVPIGPIGEKPSNTHSFISLPLYDIFVTFHYYTIRDENLHESKPDLGLTKNDIPDFAHEGSAFLSWHRAYLLYFETELQHMLNDSSFALPYWDWTAYEKLKAENNAECPDIFSIDLFGENGINCCLEDPMNPGKNINENGLPIITNKFNWIPVCTNYIELRDSKMLCNPVTQQSNYNISNSSSLSITRCVGCNLGEQCRANGKLPSTCDVNKLNNKMQSYHLSYYDVPDYNSDKNTDGFRNFVEGFYNFNNKNSKFAEMHNKVHIYIGGLMMNVPTSSNDPIFWLHHCNIDRLYEKWFENPMTDTSYKPTPKMNSVEYAVGFGHNGYDNAGLLFPPITNVDAHKRGSELGYSYQDPISCIPSQLLTSCPTAVSTPSPVSTTSNPGNDNQTPGDNDQIPGGSNQTPGGNDQTPGGNDQTPGGNDQTPGGNDQTPDGNDQIPGGNNRNPSGNNQNPSGIKDSLHPSYMVNIP